MLCKSHFAGPVSGSDETLVAYATHLHRGGYSIAIVLLYPPAHDDRYYVRLRQTGVEVVTIASSRRAQLVLGWLRAAAARLSRTFRVPASLGRWSRVAWHTVVRRFAASYQKKCDKYFQGTSADLMHVLTPDPGAELLIRAGAAAGIPVLYQELGTPNPMPELEPHYERFLKVFPLCDEVAALSPLLARQWEEKVQDAQAVSVLPLLVEDGDTRRAESARHPGGCCVGFAARLERGKGPLVLLDAFAQVRQQVPDITLRLAGTGRQEEAVRARAASLGVSAACDFRGAYTDAEGKGAFMRGLDVFVLPSLAEGTPNSVIEAMAHGLPIVASAVGGIPDLITPETGILVPPGDAPALAAAILSLASDPEARARMGLAARARYEALFSPRSVLPVLVNTYRRVASKDRRTDPAQRAPRFTHPWLEGARS
ncbi:MAG: glycosyltransferase family 4 protein [Pyrinomonadaceae bacterium]